MDEIGEWRAMARDLMQAGHDIFATADVQVTEKGYADEKYLALTLLARTMSNFRGALLLLDNRRVIEGRIITRCCLENSFWVAGLVEEGEKFSREMLQATPVLARIRRALISRVLGELKNRAKDAVSSSDIEQAIDKLQSQRFVARISPAVVRRTSSPSSGNTSRIRSAALTSR